MTAQIHVRVSSEFKRAVKIYCAREGITEQRWTQAALETALGACAPDLVRSGSPRGTTPAGTGKRPSARR